MLTWIKSLITDVPAGTFMVVASLALVGTLMFALGEIAASQPERDVLYSSSPASAHASSVMAVSTGSHNDISSSRSSVSVMVPVGSFR